MQERTTPQRTELHTTIIATSNELIAVCAAITTYQKWLNSTPESAAEHQDIIKLLDRFQRRLTQLPSLSAPQQEASHERA
jgi:hypothetical protein